MKVDKKTSDLSVQPEQRPMLVDKRLIDYAFGFLIGTICSIFSFYLLSFMKNRKRKRMGMFWGCIFSFLLIFLMCLSFAGYTSYVQNMRKRNHYLKNHDRRLQQIQSFGAYIKSAIGNLLPSKSKKGRNLYQTTSKRRNKIQKVQKKHAVKAKNQKKAYRKLTNKKSFQRKSKKAATKHHKNVAKKSKKRHHLLV